MKESIAPLIADAVTQEPVTFTVDVLDATRWQRILQRFGKYPKQRTFELRPLVYATLMKITACVDVMESVNAEANMAEEVFRLLKANGEKQIDVIALALWNRRGDPPASYKDFISYNFTPAEGDAIMEIIFSKMGLMAFLNTTISMKGMGLKNMSGTIAGTSESQSQKKTVPGVSQAA